MVKTERAVAKRPRSSAKAMKYVARIYQEGRSWCITRVATEQIAIPATPPSWRARWFRDHDRAALLGQQQETPTPTRTQTPRGTLAGRKEPGQRGLCGATAVMVEVVKDLFSLHPP